MCMYNTIIILFILWTYVSIKITIFFDENKNVITKYELKINGTFLFNSLFLIKIKSPLPRSVVVTKLLSGKS